MPVIGKSSARTHRFDGVVWTSYVAPSSGSAELCAWRIDMSAGNRGAVHRVNREEVLYVLDGEFTVTIDGREAVAAPGDAVLIPPGREVGIDNRGRSAASAWVTTRTGFVGTLTDGSTIIPEWTR